VTESKYPQPPAPDHLEQESSVAVPPPDRSLTLRPDRLAGSPRCLNCGTELLGPFCHYCGQPDKNLMRFFPVLIRELMEDFLDFDSRFMRTMKPLLFKPGHARLPRRPALSLHPTASPVHLLEHRLLFPGGGAGHRCNRHR